MGPGPMGGNMMGPGGPGPGGPNNNQSSQAGPPKPLFPAAAQVSYTS